MLEKGEEEEAMGKAKKTRKFAQVKRMITPKAIKQSVLHSSSSATLFHRRWK